MLNPISTLNCPLLRTKISFKTDCNSLGILNENSLKKKLSNLVSLQQKDLAFSESCWVNAVSRCEYCGNILSAKVALFLMIHTQSKGFLCWLSFQMVLKWSLKLDQIHSLKCNRLFPVAFSKIATAILLASFLKFLTSSAVFPKKIQNV